MLWGHRDGVNTLQFILRVERNNGSVDVFVTDVMSVCSIGP